MEMHDAWFFIGVLVFIFLVWAATGGPSHPLSFAGPRLALPQELGGGSYLQLPRAPYDIGNVDYSLQEPSTGSATFSRGASSGGGSSDASQVPLPTIAGGVFGPPSLYHGIVTMSHYISGSGSLDPNNEYVEVSVSRNSGVPVDLTGWMFSSDATGNASLFPKGTEIPMSGIVNAAQDIVLSPGTRAIILSGRSPIGASFRENKCIGYFGAFQTFNPALPQNCPMPSEELTSHYDSNYIRDAACIDYVNRVSRCQVTITPPINISGACQSFLVKYLNYNGCVDAHRDDPDFLSNTWRIYLGRTTPLWRTTHEVVKFLDASGKTVDAFGY